jgi:hypothetical protein
MALHASRIPGIAVSLLAFCVTTVSAQVTRAGFLPEAAPEDGPAPHEPPFLFVSHAWVEDANVIGARTDLWGRGWGVALGADYISAGSAGFGLNTALLLRLRRHETFITAPGVQAQLGANLVHIADETRFRFPLTVGAFIYAPAPLPLLGRSATRLWLNGQVVWQDDADTGIGGGAGFWLTSNQPRTWQQGWGLQLAFSHTAYSGPDETVFEVGINRVLKFGP